MRCRNRRVLLLTAVLGMIAAVAHGQEAGEHKLNSLLKLISSKGGLTVCQVMGEEDGKMVLLDLKTGKESAVSADDVEIVERDVTDAEAIKWVGLPAFLACRIKEAQKVKTTGKIVTVTPTSVYVNLGARDGIEKGAKLLVYREGEELKDPETGEVLGTIRSKRAQLEVFEIEEKFCKARQVSEMEAELARGDTVSLANPSRAIAVMPLTDATGESHEAAYGFAEEWTTELAARGVPMVERRQMDRVLVELGLQQSGLIDPETAAKVGKQLGAFAVLTGSVTPTKPGHARTHARLVKVSTGEVLVACSEEFKEADRAVIRRPAITPVQPGVGAPVLGGPAALTGYVEEGVGLGAVRIGATQEDVKAALGTPENNDPNWLVYKRSRGIDVVFSDGRTANEIRFNPGFQGRFRSGVGIGSSIQQVVTAYGQPLETRNVAKGAKNVFDDRVFYRWPGGGRLHYKQRGVLFWFDDRGTVSQFVIGRPTAAAPPLPAAVPQGGVPPKTRVSLTRPYPESYPGADTHRMSLQFAVQELARQVGLGYNRAKSDENIGSTARMWVTPDIENEPFDEAMSDLLRLMRVRYQIVDGAVVLVEK